MNFNPFLRDRHARWQRDVDAYIDGQLVAGALLRFEQHLDGCEVCADTVALTRTTKTAIASLPVLQAPRSFALTEAMLASTPAELSPSRAPGVTYRLAQAATFAALASLATLVVVDVSGGNSGSRDTAATAELETLADKQPVPASGYAPDTPSLVPPVADASASGAEGTPVEDGAVGAAGSDDKFGDDMGGNDDGGERIADPDQKITPQDDPGPLEPAASLQFDAADEDGGPGGLRIVQATLGALAIAAAGAWWLLRRRQRVSWS